MMYHGDALSCFITSLFEQNILFNHSLLKAFRWFRATTVDIKAELSRITSQLPRLCVRNLFAQNFICGCSSQNVVSLLDKMNVYTVTVSVNENH